MNRKLKRFLGLFFYSVLVIVIYFVGEFLFFKLILDGSLSRDATSIYTYRVIWLIIVGLFIALPGFATQSRKKGPWLVDWLKLTAIGIPLVSVLVIRLYFINNAVIFVVIPEGLTKIISVVLGYLFLTALHKEPQK